MRVAGCVGVVRVLHDTMIYYELPGGWQETALAAPHTVVLSEIFFVLIVGGQGTVDKLLLGETHGRSLVLLGDCAFEGGDSGKRPTRTAVALILNRENPTVSVVIDSGCTVNFVLEATATAATAPSGSVINERVVALWAFATEELCVLIRLEVGCPVVAKDKGVGVSIICMLAIVICDRRVVDMVTALLPLEGARVRHVLVVLRAV